MAMITYLGGPETGDRGTNEWGRFIFVLNQPVFCDDPHIIAKASKNRFFKVEGGGGKVAAEIVPDDPADDPAWGADPEPVGSARFTTDVLMPEDVAPAPVVKLDPLAKARAAKAAKRAGQGDAA